MSNKNEPHYQIIEKFENFEIRKYVSIISASVKIKGNRADTINNGFKILINYINKEKIPMTIPVLQEKISSDDWIISFVMPDSYNLSNLPHPNDKSILINEIHPKKMLTIRFSGFNSNHNIQKNLEILNKYIQDKGYQPIGNAILAFYNPPWTLPFFKRNEIMIEI